MKRGIILLNGEPWSEPIETDGAFVVCCDGAYRWAKDVRIDLKVGDFDSLGYVPDDAQVYPTEKDCTDGEIAMDYLLEHGFDTIDIYGGGGGREDHFFGNMQLLVNAERKGAQAVMHTRYTHIGCVGVGKTVWKGKQGKTLSLAPIGESVHIMESKGLKYPLLNLTLAAGACRGVSNVIEEDNAYIVCDCGEAFVFEVREDAKW